MTFVDTLRRFKRRMVRRRGRALLRVAAWRGSRWAVRGMRNSLGIQLNEEEIRAVSAAVRARGRAAKFLIFGTGMDSEFWWRLNRRGETCFVEDNLEWVARARTVLPHLNLIPMEYQTQRSQWRMFLSNPSRLEVGMPEELAATKWDIILVDGPEGHRDDLPGRMKSIFFASQLAAEDADIFVHDCDREVERACADGFLGARNLEQQVGRLRHYRVTVCSPSLQ